MTEPLRVQIETLLAAGFSREGLEYDRHDLPARVQARDACIAEDWPN